MNIYDIAAIINEDPDIINEYVISEAPDSFYLNFFNKSLAIVPANFDISDLGFVLVYSNLILNPVTGKQQRNIVNLYGWVPNGADKYRTPFITMRDLPIEARLRIIHLVKSVVPPELIKYEPYFMIQAVNGKLPLDEWLHPTADVLSGVIASFIKFSRKSIWGQRSKDIFKYTNWWTLKKELEEIQKSYVDYSQASDSKILHTKKYFNNVISLLLGGQPEVTTYWFRSVLNPEAACKYGKGTKWCTSVAAPPRDTADYDDHPAFNYINRAGLYVIEVETATMRRRPILQISGDHFMNVNDVRVYSIGSQLKDFLGEVLNVASDEIHERTLGHITRMIELSSTD
jgi:hypothetical protein